MRADLNDAIEEECRREYYTVDCSRLTMLDRIKRVDQKIKEEQIEDEGIEYRQTNGVGETEHRAG